MGVEFNGGMFPHEFEINQMVLPWGLIGKFAVIEKYPVKNIGRVSYLVFCDSGPHKDQYFRIPERRLVADGMQTNEIQNLIHYLYSRPFLNKFCVYFEPNSTSER